MNIVNSGTSYQIFDESVKTYQHLPVGCYQINFNPMSGFSLSAHNSLTVLEDKIYGNTEKNVEKILKSYKLSDRNFGVILSGEKGAGKTLFAKVLAKKANEMGMSLILATKNYPGLEDFISSVEEDVVVLFDEFEKNFGSAVDSWDDATDEPIGTEGGVQNNLLGLFDGIDNGKKLFVITCNETYKLSKYLLNRPGRFHYHFRIVTPSADEIQEYLNDKLNPEYQSVIPTIVSLSLLGSITYDCLRALAFDINQGYSLEETLDCLNLTRDRSMTMMIEVTLDNGKTLSTTDYINLANDKLRLYLYDGNGAEARIEFDSNAIRVRSGELGISPSDIKLLYYTQNDMPTEMNGAVPVNDIAANRLLNKKAEKVISARIQRVDNSFIYKYMV